MTKRYFIGNRGEVLSSMVQCAIRDQRTLIEAIEAPYERSSTAPTPEDAEAIASAKAWIEDFERLGEKLGDLML